MSNIRTISCPNCGARIESPNENDGMMVCSYCGASLFVDYDEEDARIITKKIDAKMQDKRIRYEKERDQKKLTHFFVKLIAVVAAFAILPSIIIFFAVFTAETITEKSENKYRFTARDANEIQASTLSAIHDGALLYMLDKVPDEANGYKRTSLSADFCYLVAENNQDKNRLYVLLKADYTLDSDTQSAFVSCHLNNITGTEPHFEQADFILDENGYASVEDFEANNIYNTTGTISSTSLQN